VVDSFRTLAVQMFEEGEPFFRFVVNDDVGRSLAVIMGVAEIVLGRCCTVHVINAVRIPPD
jgi:hypothetical protein